MVKKEKHRKLHGSVLLTVVCVMSLLIVFLFGTLTLATATNNRAHVNYSSAQTDVTSRIVVDAAIKAIAADDEYGKFIGSIKDDAVGTNAKTIPIAFGSDVPNIGKYGKIVDDAVKVEWAGTKSFYDPTDNKWIEGGVLKFSATASMAGVNSTTTAYVVKNPAGGGGGGGGGAGFVTTAGAKLPTQSSLYGGSYIDLPEATAVSIFDYNYRKTAEEYANWKHTIDPSNPFDDGYDHTIYRQFDADDKSFNLQNNGGCIEADLYVNNNMYMENWQSIYFPDLSKGITVWGDWGIGSNASTNLNYYASDKIRTAKDIPFNQVPYIYVDGEIKQTQATDIKFGDATNPFPLNIFCGNLNLYSKANKHSIYADVYCMNPYATSKIGNESDKGSALYDWSSSVIGGNPTQRGTYTKGIFSKGNVQTGNIKIDGDLVVEGDLDLGALCDKNCDIKIEVTGNIYVGGTLKLAKKVDITKVLTNYNKDPAQKTGHIYCNPANVIIPGYTPTSPTKDETNYTEVPVIVSDTVEERYFFRIDTNISKTVGTQVKYYNAFDEEGDNGYFEVWKWKNGFNPADFGFSDNSYRTPDGWLKGITDESAKKARINQLKSQLYEQVENKYYISPEENNGSNSQEYYLTSYRYVPSMASVNTGQTMSSLASKPGFSAYETSSVVVYRNSDGEIVPWGTNLSDLKLPFEYFALPEKIYPEYAEKMVILGIDSIEGVDKKDSKIIKTFDDVLKGDVNPYKDAPGVFKQTSSWPTYTDITDVGRKADGTVDEYIYVCNVDDKTGTYDVVDVNGNAKTVNDKGEEEIVHKGDVQGVVIKRDCILHIGGIDAKYRYIVFEPQEGAKNSELNVVIEQLNVPSDHSVIVNDRNKKYNTNFYVTNGNGGKGFSHGGNGYILTTTYCNFVGEANGGAIGYNSSNGKPLDGKDENGNSIPGRPCLNIYGPEGGTFSLEATKYISANITSPSLEVNIAASSSKVFEDFYYDDLSMSTATKHDVTGLLFGCLNAGNVSIKNDFFIAFVTDGDSGYPGNIEGDGFDYRVLYYDEY